MTKYITVIIVAALVFCFSEEAYCFSMGNLQQVAQQAVAVAQQAAANKASKKASNNNIAQQAAPQGNNEQTQATNNNNTPNQAIPVVTKEDILTLMKKIKTNLTEEQLTRSAECTISLGAYPYTEFGLFLFLVGEGQFSKQDKERILKKQVGDPGTNWKSKIRNITVNGATMMVETDMMTYSGNGMVPDKVDYIFTKAGSGVIAFDSIQIASKGVRAGGDEGAMVFTQTMDAIAKFIAEGHHEQVW